MSKAWIHKKRSDFARDVLRDFCVAADALEELFKEFDRAGRVDFEGLKSLLGEEMNKGLLWRLKDTSHHLFRRSDDESVVGRFLDWSVGYVFHETIKLKEDAYQRQYYGPWFQEMQSSSLPEMEAGNYTELMQVLHQTRESISREVQRIRFILSHCTAMFPVYLAAYGDNKMVARFIFEQNSLVKKVFASEYANLIQAMYKGQEEQMLIVAAQGLVEGGWMDEAKNALNRALKINPDCVQASMALVRL